MHSWFVNIYRPSDKAQTQKEFVYCWDSEKNKREFPEDFGTQYARHGVSESATKYWPSPFCELQGSVVKTAS
jgi:hypothetical protein